MANVIVCDRCRKLTDSAFITIGVRGQRSFDPVFKKLSPSYDLCPACAKDLSNFLHNRPIKIDQ